MLNDKLFAVAALAAVLGSAACRPGRLDKTLVAKDQGRGQLTLPTQGDANAPMDLTSTELNANYMGNLLLWNPHATPEQISAVARASNASKAAKAAAMQFRAEQVAPLDAALAVKDQDIQANLKAIADTVQDKLNSPEARALKIKAASEWFDASVGKLTDAQILDGDGAANARDLFKAYCEYKLYELAVSPLLRFDFAERPSPLQMCEGYYREQGLFAAGTASCKTAAEQGLAQANYFNCIWGEAVFKSQTFAALAAAPGATGSCEGGSHQKRAAKLQEWFASGLLQIILFDDTLMQGGTVAFSQAFAKSLLDNTPLSEKPWRPYPYKEVHDDCRQIGRRNDLAVASPPIWQQAILTDLKFIGETAPGTSQKFTLLQLSAAASASPEAVKLASDMASKFRMYAERKKDGGRVTLADGSVRTDIGVSADDEFFNQPVGVRLEAPAENARGAREDADLNRIFAVEDALKPAALIAKGKVLESERADLVKAKADRAIEAAAFDEENGVQSKNGALAVAAAGVATLSRAMSVSIRTLGESAEVRVTFGGSKDGEVLGCVNLVGGGASCPDLAADATRKRTADAVVYERATGKLFVRLTIDDATALGLGYKERAADAAAFGDLTDEQLNGRTLELDIYPNRLNAYYEFITGTVRVVGADGTVEHLGSFTADMYVDRS